MIWRVGCDHGNGTAHPPPILGVTLNKEWKHEAACKEYPPELWFSYKKGGKFNQKTREAINICEEKCSVRIECLNYAVTNKETNGVWGGKTPDEIHTIIWKRTKIRK